VLGRDIMRKCILLIMSVALVIAMAACGEVKLQLIKLDLATEVVGINNYKHAISNTFTKGEKFFIYAQVDGFTSDQVGEKYVSWPIQTIKVRDANDTLLMAQDICKDKREFDQPTTEFALPAELSLSGDKGVYHIDVIIEDGITGERIFEQLAIQIE